jgi:hypothetical protein
MTRMITTEKWHLKNHTSIFYTLNIFLSQSDIILYRENVVFLFI